MGDSGQSVLHWWGIVVNVYCIGVGIVVKVYCIGGDSGQGVLHWCGIVVNVYSIGGDSGVISHELYPPKKLLFY